MHFSMSYPLLEAISVQLPLLLIDFHNDEVGFLRSYLAMSILSRDLQDDK